MGQDKSDTRICGMVLAGGRSSRFGSDKAAALLLGRPLLLWALDHLARACDRTAVSAQPGSAAAILAAEGGWMVLADGAGDAAGPLAGIRAGLAWARGQGADFLAVEPCDAPLLPPDMHRRLGDAIGAAPVAVARTEDGLQPLCALWRTVALEAVAAALHGGAHPPIWRLLQDLGAAQVAFADPSAFVNANRPADLKAAAARLA